MNKENKKALSRAEKAGLAQIARNFELLAQIQGNEPGIYSEFDVQTQNSENMVIGQRYDLFTKLAAERIKS